MLGIPVVSNRRPMAAVIDSAAEVTILSDKIYNSLQDQPQIFVKVLFFRSVIVWRLFRKSSPKSISSSMGATYTSVQ
jgi:hypothetical protein